MSLRRFLLRSTIKVDAEWTVLSMAYDILKLYPKYRTGRLGTHLVVPDSFSQGLQHKPAPQTPYYERKERLFSPPLFCSLILTAANQRAVFFAHNGRGCEKKPMKKMPPELKLSLGGIFFVV